MMFSTLVELKSMYVYSIHVFVVKMQTASCLTMMQERASTSNGIQDNKQFSNTLNLTIPTEHYTLLYVCVSIKSLK